MSPELSIRDPPLRRTPASRSAPPTSEPPARGGAGSVRLIATLQQVVRVALIGDSQLTDTSTRPVTKLGRRLRRRGHHVDTLAVGRLDTRRALALQFRSEPADWTIFWFAVAPWMRIPPNEFATNERTSSDAPTPVTSSSSDRHRSPTSNDAGVRGTITEWSWTCITTSLAIVAETRDDCPTLPCQAAGSEWSFGRRDSSFHMRRMTRLARCRLCARRAARRVLPSDSLRSR